MIVLLSGELTVAGKRSDLERFFIEACHGTVSEDKSCIHFDTHKRINGIHFAHIDKAVSSPFYYPDGIKYPAEGIQFIKVFYSQAHNIMAKDLEKLSKKYNVDFSISTDFPIMKLSRVVEVHSGKISRNDYIEWTNIADPLDEISDAEETATVPVIQTDLQERYRDNLDDCGVSPV